MSANESSDKFICESAVKGRILVVRMSGNITEDTNFTSVLSDLGIAGSGADSVYIDLRGIKQINSPGVRDWLLFLEKLQARYFVRFLSIGECMIEQSAIIPSLLGKQGTPVDSFEAPYFCNACNLRKVVFLKTKDVLDASPKGKITAPTAQCDKCGQALQFDAFEEDFFKFLEHAAYVR